MIYEQIALQSTLWIYADSSWDQFNSGWGGWGEKKKKKEKEKALAAAFPLHGKSPENETEARESAESPRSLESSNLYAHGLRIIE